MKSLTSEYKAGHKLNGFDRVAFAAVVRKSLALASTVPGGRTAYVTAYLKFRPKPWRTSEGT